MNRRFLIRLAALGAFAGAGLHASPSAADSFGANYISNWSGCPTTPSNCSLSPPLSWTQNQATLFAGRMSVLGNTQHFLYANSSVWSTDSVEDKDFGGQDNLYADNVDVYMFSGHGAAWSNAWGQTFAAPMCGTHAPGYSCYMDAEYLRGGEEWGPYSTPNPGKLRWLLLATCYSVHDRPDEQWGQSFWYGMDMVLGYRGLSADSEMTDEVPMDLAQGVDIHVDHAA